MADSAPQLKTPEECTTIDEIRQAIDQIDHEIVQAIGRRYGYVKAIMRFKSTEEDVRAPARYQAVLDQRRAWAEDAGLDPDVIEQLYVTLIRHFIDYELAALKEGEQD